MLSPAGSGVPEGVGSVGEFGVLLSIGGGKSGNSVEGESSCPPQMRVVRLKIRATERMGERYWNLGA